MARRKNYYNTNNNYKVRKNRIVLVGSLIFVLVVGFIGYLNYHRISMLSKGYTWSETSNVLKTFDKEDEKIILSYDKLDSILAWVALSDDASMYNYYEDYYYLIKTEDTLGEQVYFDEHVQTVDFIDELYNVIYPKIEKQGFSEEVVWSLLPSSTITEFEFLIDEDIQYDTVKNYITVPTYKISNSLDYIEAYKEVEDYNYSVGIVNFPFILSTNESYFEYTLTDPSDILNLVKKGFYLPEDYEPDDLVKPEIPIANEEDNDYLVRQEVADALLLMYEDAKKEDMHLILNSAYRSYNMQFQTYIDFEERYGGLYASEYVALPGASEHQTGLGIDLTAQRVLDGERMVFGDTVEYQWVLENSYKYGFIVRFDEETADITGIAHEPWHLRYIGEETATKVYESGLTYEEYCLYNAIFPIVEKR